MNRTVFAVISAAALLGLAGAASAGPCEQLQGARWVHYIDGGSPARAGVAVIDFRSTVAGAPIFAAAGNTPFPAPNPSAPYGASYVQQVVSCSASGQVATLVINVGASVLFTVSADGKSATTAGGQNMTGMTGWAVRQPGQ
ncbi:hypothetical protein [Brevundimonas sp.]|uniref:hypothetical protein n=1 Tax=Brevundimonas sp. TaxID=1871086 RepID=UPI002FC9D8BE